MRDPYKKAAEAMVRDRRNKLLAATDWQVLPDLNPSAELLAYRQSLRDVTGQVGFPNDVVWPTKPE